MRYGLGRIEVGFIALLGIVIVFGCDVMGVVKWASVVVSPSLHYQRWHILSSLQVVFFCYFFSFAGLNDERVVHYFALFEIFTSAFGTAHNKIIWLFLFIRYLLCLNAYIIIKLAFPFHIFFILLRFFLSLTSIILLDLQPKLLPVFILHFMLALLLFRINVVQSTFKIPGKRNIIIQVQSFTRTIFRQTF